MDSGVYGAEVSAMSVIVVYHLFSIQTWLQASLTIEGEVETVRGATIQGDLSRENARRRVAMQVRRFPWFMVMILGAALTALACIGGLAGLQLATVHWLYTCGPVGVLVVTFFGASVASWREGKKALERAVKDL